MNFKLALGHNENVCEVAVVVFQYVVRLLQLQWLQITLVYV